MPFNKVILLVTVFLSVSLCHAHPVPDFHYGWGGHHGGTTKGMSFGLSPQFYQFSCPQANDIVMSVLEKAIAKDIRIAASLLRLHFHDCFVQVNYKHDTNTCFKIKGATTVLDPTSRFLMSLRPHQTHLTVILSNIKYCDHNCYYNHIMITKSPSLPTTFEKNYIHLIIS